MNSNGSPFQCSHQTVNKLVASQQGDLKGFLTQNTPLIWNTVTSLPSPYPSTVVYLKCILIKFNPTYKAHPEYTFW